MDGATAIGQNGANLIGMDGASLVGPDGASLVGPDGASLGTVNAPFVHASTAVSGALMVANRVNMQVLTETSGWVLAGGSLRGSGTLVGSVRNAGALIAPGGADSAGLMRLIGDFTQEVNGRLFLEIGGNKSDPPEYDRLIIAGDATFGGELGISTFGGFELRTDDNLQPLIYQSYTGDFVVVSSDASISFGPNGMTPEVLDPPVVKRPKVRVAAESRRIKEGKKAIYHITVPPGTTRPLRVHFKMSGKAKARKDYILKPTRSVVIPSGRNNALVTMKVKKDSLVEKSETVKLTLKPGSNYVLSSRSSAAIKIVNVKNNPK
jgi:hypothetical protein